ncbi:MAG: LLM class flavin-dependent oxidoreductase [Nitrospinaceae bacterium]|nr:LLM class flavin-dependent oxidoreductase [Nitrospinaceae bacterium]
MRPIPTQFHWALCSFNAGDGHQINPKVPERPATLEYLTRVVQAAEDAGCVNILVPTGTHCVDSWETAAAISMNTRKIKFLVAFRPGLVGPVYATQQANSLDYLTGGRVSLNVVSGANQADLKRYGYHTPHDERYEVTEEFLEIVNLLWEEGDPVTFNGRFFQIEDAHVWPPRATRPHPDIFVAGSSDPGKRVAARFGDVHVFFAYQPEVVAADIREVREMAETYPRDKPLEFGVRHCVCVRETKEEARRAAESLAGEAVDLANTSTWADSVRSAESTSQRRINEMASGESPWLTDTLYMGVNRVRAGGATMFVGTPEMVAAQFREYADAGVTHFIMHGWPYLEEAEIFGREVMPLLKDLDPVILPEPDMATPEKA